MINSILNKFYDDEKIVNRIGFNPYYNEISSGLEDKIIINGKEYINFASNNYLGLATNEKVKCAIIKSVEKYGASLCGTPIATGYISLFREIEEKMAKFLDMDKAIIFPSCYQANLGIFFALITKNDIVLVDRFAHSSLIQGIKATGCKIRPFLHNDTNHLKKILKKTNGYKNKFIVTESVFSTDGTIAPFDEINDIANEYSALAVVDDSHGIGILGNNGRGVLEKYGIKNFYGIYTASLGKALANAGGIVAGNEKLIRYLKYYCSHLIYSTALTPGVLGGIGAVIDIIESDYKKIKDKMNLYKFKVNKVLKESGFNAVESDAPINSIKTGKKEDTIITAKKFYEKGILTTPFIEPSVAINDGRVRIITGANLTERTLNEALLKIGEIKN